jgi:uncharacterized membrane protein
MVLPAGTTLPPLPYIGLLVVSVGGAGILLHRTNPRVTEEIVLGTSPWMLAGAALYVVYELGLAPPGIEPLFSSPAVYLVAFVGASLVWVAALDVGADPVGWLALSGLLVAMPAIVAVILSARSLAPVLPAIAAVAAAVLSGAIWWLLRAWEPQVEVLGWAGVLTVFAHALDGLTTVVGVVHLDFIERTPLSRFLLEFAAGAPVPLLGAGWLFVVVKLLLGTGVAWLLAPTVRDHPRQGFLLLIVVIAVGFGPGVHNVLLFTALG